MNKDNILSNIVGVLFLPFCYAHLITRKYRIISLLLAFAAIALQTFDLVNPGFLPHSIRYFSFTVILFISMGLMVFE